MTEEVLTSIRVKDDHTVVEDTQFNGPNFGHMGRSHGGGDHFSANTRFCKNCNFSSEIKYFSTKLLLSVINTICNKNIQKLRIN